MASITIRRLDEHVKAGLRVRAAVHGCSMEEEARRILRAAVESDSVSADLVAQIQQVVAPLGGIELSMPAREPAREPPRLG